MFMTLCGNCKNIYLYVVAVWIEKESKKNNEFFIRSQRAMYNILKMRVGECARVERYKNAHDDKFNK